MNLNQVINVCTVLLSGIGTLLEIFFITLVLALPLGLIVALAWMFGARMSIPAPARYAAAL